MTNENDGISEQLLKVLENTGHITLHGSDEKLSIFLGKKFEMTNGRNIPSKQITIQSKKDSAAIVSENFEMNTKILEKEHTFKELKAIITQGIDLTM